MTPTVASLRTISRMKRVGIAVQDDVLAGWVIGAISAVVSVHWVTLRGGWHDPGGDRYRGAMRSFQQSGALALMMSGSGCDVGSDVGGALVHGVMEADIVNDIP